MGSEKISEMPLALSLAGDELFPIVQGGANVAATIDQILQRLNALIGVNNIALGGSSLPFGDPKFRRIDPDTLEIFHLQFVAELNNATATFNVTSAGFVLGTGGANITGPVNVADLHAGNGTSASGVLTTFTIVDGIVTSAT